MRFRTVSRSRPCKICNKPDWCALSFNGQVSMCRRIEGGVRKIDKSGCDFWLHGMPEKKIRERGIKLKNVNEDKKINPPVVLDEIYNVMLDSLSLSKLHRENLLNKRKIPESHILKNKYRSLTNADRKDTAERLLNQFGSEICSKTPGLYQLESGEWRIAGCEGLLIPVRDKEGLIIGLKIRSSRLGKYIWLSSKSKGGVSPGCPIHFPIFNYSKIDEIRITEGELKADIATIYTDIPTISIPGVSSWRKVIPVLQKIKPKLVRIAFDADYDEKRLVAASLVKMISYLKKSGHDFKVEVWNE